MKSLLTYFISYRQPLQKSEVYAALSTIEWRTQSEIKACIKEIRSSEGKPTGVSNQSLDKHLTALVEEGNIEAKLETERGYMKGSPQPVQYLLTKKGYDQSLLERDKTTGPSKCVHS